MKRRKKAFSNDIIASTEAHEKYLVSISAQELKEALLRIIKEQGMTFAEEEFMRLITENWYKNRYK